MPFRHRFLAALAIGALLSAAACSSDKPETIDNPLEVAIRASAGPASIKGTTGSGSGSPVEGSYQGESVATGQGSVRGQITTGGATVPLEMRWRDGRIYIKRTARAGSVSGVAGQFLNADPVRAAWTNAGATSAAARIVTVFLPPALAAEMKTADATTADGPEIGGAATTKYTVKRDGGLMFFWSGPSTTEFFVDDQQRIVRVAVAVGDNRLSYDVTYGGKVTVEKPSAAGLATPSTTAVVVEPVGAFVEARSGDTRGLRWSVQRAPGSHGSVCWKLVSEPALFVQAPNVGDDTRCLALPAADDDRAEQAQFVITSDGSKNNALVAVTPPSGATSAVLGYNDGTKETVPVDGDPFVRVYSSDAPLVFIGFEGVGDPIDCGVGAVGSFGDIADQTLSGRAFGLAWTCQVRD